MKWTLSLLTLTFAALAAYLNFWPVPVAPESLQALEGQGSAGLHAKVIGWLPR